MKGDRDIERAEFEKDVAVMRKLGVSGWTRDGMSIVLGVEPRQNVPVQMSAVEKAERQIEADRRREEVMFAATSVRPRTPEPRDFSNVAPRGVTPVERDDGNPTQQ